MDSPLHRNSQLSTLRSTVSEFLSDMIKKKRELTCPSTYHQYLYRDPYYTATRGMVVDKFYLDAALEVTRSPSPYTLTKPNQKKKKQVEDAFQRALDCMVDVSNLIRSNKMRAASASSPREKDRVLAMINEAFALGEMVRQWMDRHKSNRPDLKEGIVNVFYEFFKLCEKDKGDAELSDKVSALNLNTSLSQQSEEDCSVQVLDLDTMPEDDDTPEIDWDKIPKGWDSDHEDEWEESASTQDQSSDDEEEADSDDDEEEEYEDVMYPSDASSQGDPNDSDSDSDSDDDDDSDEEKEIEIVLDDSEDDAEKERSPQENPQDASCPDENESIKEEKEVEIAWTAFGDASNKEVKPLPESNPQDKFYPDEWETSERFFEYCAGRSSQPSKSNSDKQTRVKVPNLSKRPKKLLKASNSFTILFSRALHDTSIDIINYGIGRFINRHALPNDYISVESFCAHHDQKLQQQYHKVETYNMENLEEIFEPWRSRNSSYMDTDLHLTLTCLASENSPLATRTQCEKQKLLLFVDSDDNGGEIPLALLRITKMFPNLTDIHLFYIKRHPNEIPPCHFTMMPTWVREVRFHAIHGLPQLAKTLRQIR